MADLKISQLPGATTPLIGDEIIPIVQSSTTKQVSVNNLTAGKSISAASATLTTGNLVIGTSGKGIDFSATGGATGVTGQILDDYEFGTWTPTLTFGGGSVGVTYAIQNGYYKKIGNLVWVSFVIVLSSKGASTGLAEVSLPFSGPYSNENHVSGAPTRSYLMPKLLAFKMSSATVVFRNAIGDTSATDADFSNGTQLGFDIIYRTA